MSEFSDELKAALLHAVAIVLLKLQSLGQGYTALLAQHPLVQEGLAILQAEAAARGVSPEEAQTVTPAHIVTAAQEMGAAGADVHAVAAETKAPGTPELTEAHLTEPTPEPVPVHAEPEPAPAETTEPPKA